MIWFSLVLWHINYCRLFNAKSSSYICIQYIWFGLVWFYGISTFVGFIYPAEWEPAPDRVLRPLVTHGWAAQPECERSAAMVRRTWGQYVAICPRLQLTSHTEPTSTLSRIKGERYIFIKKCVRSFIEVRHYCWLCFRLYYVYVYVHMQVYVLWVYNILIYHFTKLCQTN